MAEHPGTITNLRYANRRILDPEQQLQRNYFRELIHSYGVDASYFRHNVDAYQISGVNFDYIYGEQPAVSYWLSAHVVVYMESKGDIELLNKFGFETDGDMESFILIDDFSEQFRDLVGTTTSATFSIPLYGNVTAGDGYISGTVNNTILDGWVIDTNISESSSGFVSGTFSQEFVRDPRLYNEYVFRSESYDNRVVYGTLDGTWSGTITSGLNGVISGAATGLLGYHIETSTVDGGGPNWNIAPKAGDFFRLDFVDENNEEYEITKVIDRNLQVEGLNPLLSKYVWQMTCVRRDASYEDVIGGQDNMDSSLDGTGQKEEQYTRSKVEQNDWIEEESNELFDYSEDIIDDYDGLNSDDIYGGYDKD